MAQVVRPVIVWVNILLRGQNYLKTQVVAVGTTLGYSIGSIGGFVVVGKMILGDTVCIKI